MSTAKAQVKTFKDTDSDVQSTLISLESFLAQFYNMEDGYKYEWNHGAVEKTKTMNQEQTTIYLLLSRLFCKTKAFEQMGGLTAETDIMTSKDQLRRPDIAFFSGVQINKMKKGKNQLPKWVAEIISETDNINRVEKKLDEYFAAGIKVVWHIYPSAQKVYVYTAPDQVTICMGDTICSGAPVLPDFQVSAKTLFGN